MSEFATAYGPKIKVVVECPKGRTEQSFTRECDINNIMARYVKTGNLDHAKSYEEFYGDSTSIELHEALNIIKTADSMFNELPAKTRERFKNDPGEFLDFVQDEKNHQEMYDLGLATKPPTPVIQEPAEPDPPPVIEP